MPKNYEDLDTIDLDEDKIVEFENSHKFTEEFEEDLDDEFEENLDEDDPKDLIDATEKLREKLKHTASKAFGIDTNKETFDSTGRFVSDYVAEHGIWGLTKGIIKAVAASIGEIIHAFAYNLMGRPEHIDLKRALEATNLKEKGKEERKQRDEEKTVGNQEIDEQTSKENIEAQQEVFSSRNEKDNELDRSIEKELNDKSKELFEDKESLNQIIDVCLNHSSIQKMFREGGLHPINIEGDVASNENKNAKNIYLFSENAEMDIKRVLCIPKKDFMMGNATMFAAALFSYNKTNDDMNERLTAVIQASILQARIRKAIHEDLLSNLPDNNKTTLTYAKFETTEMDGANISVNLLDDSNTAYVEYNGKEIGTFNLNEQENGELEKLVEEAMKEYEKSKERNFVIGDIEIERLSREKIAIDINGKREEIQVKEEKDLQKISAYLQNEKGFSIDEGNIRAMLIGAYALPGMQKTIDSFGYEMNPFTNERKKIGDIVIGKHSNIERYKIEISENKETHTSEVKNTSEVISYMPKYWKGVNLDKCISKIEYAMQEKVKHDAIDDIIVPADAKRKIETLTDPYWSNGYLAYQELKTKCVLDGIDIDSFKIIDEKNEPNLRKNYENQKFEDKSKSEHQKDHKKDHPEKENIEGIKNHFPTEDINNRYISTEELEEAGFERFIPDDSFEGFENASYIKADIDDIEH